MGIGDIIQLAFAIIGALSGLAIWLDARSKAIKNKERIKVLEEQNNKLLTIIKNNIQS